MIFYVLFFSFLSPLILYHVKAPNEIGEHVISMGIDAVNLANNHANDAGIEGRNNTINFFKQHNILTTGVYESK